MKNTGIFLIVGALGAAVLLMGAQRRKREAEQQKAAAALEQYKADTPAYKPKKKKKKKKKKVDKTPEPSFSFEGTVIGECVYNGGPGLMIEHADGYTECVSAT
jgi:Tfp pilus assembly protein PilV